MKTITAIERQSVIEKVAMNYGNGLHGAEAVDASVVKALGEKPAEATAHATWFGGGFGRTYKQICVGLSGALIAIGHFLARFSKNIIEEQTLGGGLKMNVKNIEVINSILKDISISFVGDPSRGKRLQEAAKKCGWKLQIKQLQNPVADDGIWCPPDLVMLDNFPESPEARTVFFQFSEYNGVVFLALNEKPQAMRFLHINALTRLKIIDRHPDPKILISAIVELVLTGRKSPALHAGIIEASKQSLMKGRTNPINCNNLLKSVRRDLKGS